MLGRGLADLIPVGGDAAAGGSSSADLGPGQELPIAKLHPNPRQPRTHFDETALAELAASIKDNGILQPILVRPRTAGGYEIVAGERRYRAALRAGLKQVPVVVRQLTDEETLALALIENLIREDIGPMETARAFQRLMEDFGWTQEEMGRRVGKSRSSVANTLRLLSLPEPIQESLEMGQLSEGHVRMLIGDERQRQSLGFRERQLAVWKQIVLKNLSVREVERLMKAERSEALGDSNGSASVLTYSANSGVEGPRGQSQGKGAPADAADLRALEDRLRTALGTQVRLSGSESRGRVEIEFFSAEELDGLLSRLEGQGTSSAHSSVSRETPTSEPVAPLTPPTQRQVPPKSSSGRIQGLLSSQRSS